MAKQKRVDARSIHIEVGCAGRDLQIVKRLLVEPGTSVAQTIALSGILNKIKFIDTIEGRVGIFGRVVALEQCVHEGDRIEIYQDLYCDPKQSRKIRAEKTKTKKKRI